ncbi:GxxExxY protein [Humisphaera borealis]|uniref:GxxExxY protein n=1 Tax=Humisphaera borealis TaxID=2807512 RepID=A0A7M2X1Z5_9BACT|nr:GxxExxY protein [Humisphaera borealis]QOV91462.1 GxxExxY protein [Humisphaera borealis]
MHRDEHRLNQLTGAIIGCAFRVANRVRCGFFEKVDENALCVELRKAGLKFEQQARFAIMYDGVVVGEYVADLIVEHTVLLEVKAVKTLDEIHMAQCINYLSATGLPVCLLMNFVKPDLEYKRVRGNGRRIE